MTDTPIDHVEVYTDTAGEHRWRAVANNGRTIADSGEGYKNRSQANVMAERMFPGIEIRDVDA